MKPEIRVCRQCGIEFEARDPRKMYCSEKCNSRVHHMKKWNTRRNLKPRTCDQCGTVFQPSCKRARFCSEKCHTTWSNTHREYPHTCKGCGTTFVSRLPRSKYCTRSCALKHTRVTRTLVCEDCGVSFEFIGRTRKRRCKPCWRIHWNAYYAKFQAGNKVGPRDQLREKNPNWQADNRYRRIVRALPGELRYKYRNICFDAWPRYCAICKSRDNVEVHHIDGDRSNYQLGNLVPLCKRHHVMVHRKPHKTTWTSEQYRESLWRIWPDGRQVIGTVAKQFADLHIANSVNALPVRGRANTELGSKEPSVETVHDAPHRGEEPVQRTNQQLLMLMKMRV